jgi:DNA-binding PucR family transcriptional regulator
LRGVLVFGRQIRRGSGRIEQLLDRGQNDARLRETLRMYLACGASYKVAAEELNMHFNSVKYRVGRAVARRGREIGSDRLEVELALLACHWYGPAVLQP